MMLNNFDTISRFDLKIACFVRAQILIVSEDPSTLWHHEEALSSPDYDLCFVSTIAEAEEVLCRADFALIVLELNGDERRCFEVARRIRVNAAIKETPVIVSLNRVPTNDFLLEAIPLGIIECFETPLQLPVLKARFNIFTKLFLTNRKLEQQSVTLKNLEARERELLRREQDLDRLKSNSDYKYQKLIEGLRNSFVWSADPNSFEFKFVGPQVESIFGVPRSDWLVHKEIAAAWFSPEMREKIASLMNTHESGSPRVSVDHSFGNQVWLCTDMRVGFDPLLNRQEILGLSINVTHLKEAEASLRQAVLIRDEFISIASHELRTPITPLQLQMQGFSRLIDTHNLVDVPAATLRYMLDISTAQVGRLSRLIEQLLDTSRISEGRLVLDLAPTRLSEVVRSAFRQLGHEIEISDSKVSLTILDDSEGQWDALRLEQVAVNLISNSLKYAAGSPIDVTLSVEGTWAHVTVSDKGIGIDPADQERIFERFERAVPLKHYSGLGLGLYFVRQIVEMHHGRIQVQSKAGSGASFRIDLPIERNLALPKK